MCRKIWVVCVVTMGLFAVQFSGLGNASQITEKELFKGFKTETIWKKEFDGKIMDIQVGDENIAVLKTYRYFDHETRKTVRLREDWDYCLAYLDSDGNVLWEKWFKEEYGKLGKTALETVKGRVANISVSHDGEYVVINQYWGFFPRFLAQCYDTKGALVWEAKCEEPGLIISPYGSYAIQPRQEGEEMMGCFRIFDKTGKEIWKDKEKEVFEEEPGKLRGQINWTATWLDDSTVAWVKGSPVGSFSCHHPYGKLILFDVKRLQSRREVDIGKELGDPEHFGISWYTPPIKTSEDGKFIAVAVDWFEKNEKDEYRGVFRKEKRTLVVLNNNGNLLWHTNDFVTMEDPEIKGRRGGGLGSFSFTEDSKHLIAVSVRTIATPRTIDFYDAHIGKRKWRKTPEGGWFWMESLGLREIPPNVAGITPILHEDKVKSVILLDKDGRRIQLIQLED